jgi:hypothetical protein
MYAYCTLIIATISYKPSLALNPLFTSFHCNELAIIVTYYYCLASNRLFRTENMTLLLFDFESTYISNRKQFSHLVFTRMDLLKRLDYRTSFVCYLLNHYNYIFESDHYYSHHIRGGEGLVTID